METDLQQNLGLIPERGVDVVFKSILFFSTSHFALSCIFKGKVIQQLFVYVKNSYFSVSATMSKNTIQRVSCCLRDGKQEGEKFGSW